jgi:hypothetical protein
LGQAAVETDFMAALAHHPIDARPDIETPFQQQENPVQPQENTVLSEGAEAGPAIGAGTPDQVFAPEQGLPAPPEAVAIPESQKPDFGRAVADRFAAVFAMQPVDYADTPMPRTTQTPEAPTPQRLIASVDAAQVPVPDAPKEQTAGGNPAAAGPDPARSPLPPGAAPSVPMAVVIADGADFRQISRAASGDAVLAHISPAAMDGEAWVPLAVRPVEAPPATAGVDVPRALPKAAVLTSSATDATVPRDAAQPPVAGKDLPPLSARIIAPREGSSVLRPAAGDAAAIVTPPAGGRVQETAATRQDDTALPAAHDRVVRIPPAQIQQAITKVPLTLPPDTLPRPATLSSPPMDPQLSGRQDGLQPMQKGGASKTPPPLQVTRPETGGALLPRMQTDRMAEPLPYGQTPSQPMQGLRLVEPSDLPAASSVGLSAMQGRIMALAPAQQSVTAQAEVTAPPQAPLERAMRNVAAPVAPMPLATPGASPIIEQNPRPNPDIAVYLPSPSDAPHRILGKVPQMPAPPSGASATEPKAWHFAVYQEEGSAPLMPEPQAGRLPRGNELFDRPPMPSAATSFTAIPSVPVHSAHPAPAQAGGQVAPAGSVVPVVPSPPLVADIVQAPGEPPPPASPHEGTLPRAASAPVVAIADDRQGAAASAMGAGSGTLAVPLRMDVPDTDARIVSEPPSADMALGAVGTAPSSQTGAAPPLPPAQTVAIATLPQVLASIARDGSPGVTEVALDPVELGRLQILVSGEGEALRIIIQAERPDTLDLLRRHADQLLEDLRQGGLSGATLSFGGNGADRGNPSAPPPSPDGPVRPPAVLHPSTPGAAWAAGTAALNLRL